MMHTIIAEDLHNKDFIKEHTDGFEELKENLQDYSPESVSPVCGIPAETIKTVARLYATAKTAIISGVWVSHNMCTEPIMQGV